MTNQMKLKHTEILGKKITYSLLNGFVLGEGYRHQITRQLEKGMEVGLFTAKSTGNNIGFWHINTEISQAFDLKDRSKGRFDIRNIFTK